MNVKCLWTHICLEFNQCCCPFPALAPCHVNLHSKSTMILLIPGRCHQCSCDSEGWSNTYTFTLGILISFTREVLSKIKGIVNSVNKSLLDSAGCNQMRPLFSLRGFGVRITNQMAIDQIHARRAKFSFLNLPALLYIHTVQISLSTFQIFSVNVICKQELRR